MAVPFLSIFFYLTLIIGISLLIVIFYFSFYFKLYEFEKDTIITYIHETLDTKFIYSLIPRKQCQPGEERLILGKWDGTKDKCKCGEKIVDDACPEKNSSCNTIEGIKPKNYTVFGGREMCVIRKGESYCDMVKYGKFIEKDKSCSEAQKSCGIVDTLGRKFCVNKDEECPLTKNNIYRVYQETILKNFISKINLEKNKIINFLEEEKNENKIISLIKLSDGLPCLNISQKNWISYHEEEKYKTQKCWPISGKTYDDRYQKFENYYTTITNLYKDNNLSQYITPNLEKNDKIINLYGTILLGLDIEENGFNYEKILSIQDLLNSCGKGMFIITIAIIVIIGLPGSCLLLFGYCVASGGNGDTDICDLVKYFGEFSGVVSSIGFIAYFIICIIIFVSIKKIKWFLKGGLTIEDDEIKLLINELFEKYSSNNTFSLAIIISVVIFFCCEVAILFFYFIKKKKEKKEIRKQLI